MFVLVLLKIIHSDMLFPIIIVAIYGISIIDKNGDIITNYAQWANDIKYFNSVDDFQNYVNKVKQKLHVVKIHYVTSFPVGNLHSDK